MPNKKLTTYVGKQKKKSKYLLWRPYEPHTKRTSLVTWCIGRNDQPVEQDNSTSLWTDGKRMSSQFLVSCGKRFGSRCKKYPNRSTHGGKHDLYIPPAAGPCFELVSDGSGLRSMVLEIRPYCNTKCTAIISKNALAKKESVARRMKKKPTNQRFTSLKRAYIYSNWLWPDKTAMDAWPHSLWGFDGSCFRSIL